MTATERLDLCQEAGRSARHTALARGMTVAEANNAYLKAFWQTAAETKTA